MKLSTLFSLVAMTATLAACGGGGTAAPAGSPAPATGNTGANAYVGSWAFPCQLSDEIKIGTAPAYVAFGLRNIAASNASTFAGQGQEQIFDNAQCSGAAKATHNWSISFAIAGTIDAKGKLADKVTVTEGAVGGGLSAVGTVTLNGITYPGNYFTRTSVSKDLLRVEGTQLFAGTDVLDAMGFPTEIDPAPIATKL